MRRFGQELFEAAGTEGPEHPDDIEAHDRVRRLAGEAGIDAALNRHGVDLLVAPTMPPAWKADLVNGDQAGSTARPRRRPWPDTQP